MLLKCIFLALFLTVQTLQVDDKEKVFEIKSKQPRKVSENQGRTFGLVAGKQLIT